MSEVDNIKNRLMKIVGENVVFEGTFPIPVGPGHVVYAPSQGICKAVYFDAQGQFVGFDIQGEDDSTPTLYLAENIRSIRAVSRIDTRKGSIIT